MTDRRFFDMPGDEAAEALLQTARKYRAPAQLRRRVEQSLGIPETIAGAASIPVGGAGVASVTGGKTLLMGLALATAGLAGGGWIAYHGSGAPGPELTVSHAPAPADPLPARVQIPIPIPVPAAAEPWPVRPSTGVFAPGTRGVARSRSGTGKAPSAAKAPRPTSPSATEDSAQEPPSPNAHVDRADPQGNPGSRGQGENVGDPGNVDDARRTDDRIPSTATVKDIAERRDSSGTQAGAGSEEPAVRAAVAPPPTALAAELELLNRAQALARHRDHRAVMTVLSEHDRRFPRGALVEEAEVMRISALFGMDEIAVATDRAEHFLEQHGDGLLGDRIRALLHRSRKN